MEFRARYFLKFLLVISVVGCAELATTTEGQDEQSQPGEEVLTGYHGSVAQVFERSCTSCHRKGGIAPFSLESYADVEGMGSVIVESIDSGRMPPWPPAPGCGSFQETRALAQSDAETLRAWVAEGSVEGAPGPEKAPGEDLKEPSQREPDLLIDIGADYIPDTERPDDYHCFILDHEFEKETYVVGTQIFPDAEGLVHHVLLFLVPGDDSDALEALDAAEEGPGFTCFGAPGVGSGTTLGGWAPGGQPAQMSENAAIVIPEGARVILQIHYNMVGIDGETKQSDRTGAGFWFLKDGEIPDYQIEIKPLANGEFTIPANEKESVHQRDYLVPQDTTIVGVTPHMHLLGKSIKLELLRDGEEPECMVHVPEWDFNWQQFYIYETDAIVEAKKGDVLRLTCTYDNSLEKQPVVNGLQQEPRDVHWGDGSLDEMCLSYISTLTPFDPDASKSPQCNAVHTCVDSCPQDDAGCFFHCGLVLGLECMECIVPKLFTCGAEVCRAESLAFLSCFGQCPDEENRPDCFTRICREDFNALYTCVSPQILDGTCDESFAECGVLPFKAARNP